MEKEEIIRDYYKTAHIILPEHPERRQFKFQLLNNKWVVLDKRIRNEEDLRKYLIRLAPKHVFCSIAQWLNPLGIEKTDYKYNKILIAIDGFLEIDADNIKEAKTELNKLVKYLKFKNIDIQNIKFSGKKGFHVTYKQDIPEEPNPEERLKLVKKQKVKLVKTIINEGVKIDQHVCMDVLRVTRVEGTVHGGSGRICTSDSLGRPLWPMTGATTRQNIEGREPAKPRSSPIFTIAKYVSSKVPGTKDLHVIFLLYHNKQNYLQDVKNLQRKYRLGDFFLFETGEFVQAMCLNALVLQRIKKIIRTSLCVNKNIIKYRKMFFRTSSKINVAKDNIWMSEPIRYQCIVSYEQKDKWVSEPHIKILNLLGISYNPLKLCGDGNVPIYKTIKGD